MARIPSPKKTPKVISPDRQLHHQTEAIGCGPTVSHIEGKAVVKVKRKQQWSIEDYFTVKLVDGSYGVGQIMDLPLPNAVSCAFFNIRIGMPHPPKWAFLTAEDIVGVATVIPSHLDRGIWHLFGRGPVLLPRDQWPNEATRSKHWVGSIVYTGAIVEDFLNAYYALTPWDKYLDPNFLDELLISPLKKPTNLMYKPSRRMPEGQS
jgi:hypothetical protein